MSNNEVGRQIRQHRKAKGWTQRQLAEATGLSLRMIQDAEAGTRMPQPANLVTIRAALGIEGDPEETRQGWPADIQVFLDVMGQFLATMTEANRLKVIREITARIVGSR